MSELFEVDIENYNLIQLARWIKSFRSYIQISDKPLYSQYPYVYQEKVSGICNEYKRFYNSHKKTLSSIDFDKALSNMRSAPRE